MGLSNRARDMVERDKFFLFRQVFVILCVFFDCGRSEEQHDTSCVVCRLVREIK